jgi:transposase
MAKLLRANFTVYDMNEFNTSKLCSGCHQELDKPLLPKRRLNCIIRAPNYKGGIIVYS